MNADHTILQGDCLELLPTIPNASVDLLIADLPYGTTYANWDQVIPMERLWPEVGILQCLRRAVRHDQVPRL